jgi:hypothetical protein
MPMQPTNERAPHTAASGVRQGFALQVPNISLFLKGLKKTFYKIFRAFFNQPQVLFLIAREYYQSKFSISLHSLVLKTRIRFHPPIFVLNIKEENVLFRGPFQKRRLSCSATVRDRAALTRKTAATIRIPIWRCRSVRRRRKVQPKLLCSEHEGRFGRRPESRCPRRLA